MAHDKELTGCRACSGYGVIANGKKCPICLNGVVEVEKPEIFDTHNMPKPCYKNLQSYPIVIVNGKRGYFVEIEE